ncbi:MAG TPA: phosphatase PAP2 family protein [Gaiellaceae bacterium]|jgi:F0F1-type ATP synthase membrane subunit c/vacuolar-type H+-ATPase subunit K|nr:phosphatase PAP2 family protein [Gaiellaceae bacterium]
MSPVTALSTAAGPHSGRVEIALLAALYGLYEVVRGFGGENWAAARDHTADIVALEIRLGVFFEREVQAAAEAIAGAPAVLGALYVALHFGGTAAALVWVHRRRPDAFAHLRTTLIVATGVALVGYVLYPAAPPRLADLGFADTVSAHTGLDLSSDLLGSLYNPIAAVPSLHFGYALAVGVALARIVRRRPLRYAAASYPAVMLLVIVATGNHFFFDAAAGALVVAAGWWAADRVARPHSRGAHAPRALTAAVR